MSAMVICSTCDVGAGALPTRMSRQVSIWRLVSASSMGSGFWADQVRAMAFEPLPGLGEQCVGLRQTLDDGGVGNRVAFVVGEVALLTQGIEDDHDVLRDTHRFGQRLQGGLVVAGLAGGGAVAVRPQADHGALHDGLVGGVEAVVGAQFGQLSVGEVAFGRGKQALNSGWRSLKRQEPVDGQQVFQGHVRFR